MTERTNAQPRVVRPLGKQMRSCDSGSSKLQASVIVCAYTERRWSQIQVALASLACQTVKPCQIVVVADHNPVLYERLKTEYPHFDVLPNRSDRGLSGARNTGVENSEGDIVAFLDDDARAEPEWLGALLAPYEDESVLGVGGRVLADWGSADKPAWLPDEFLWVVGCSYRGLPNARAEIRNPVGANMSFRKSAFTHAGLFDSSVGRNVALEGPLGCEETEFSIRLLEKSPNGRIIYEPRAVVYHHVDRSRRTLHYFLSRCYAEGCSKARVARLTGVSAALSSERHYVAHTITHAVQRELWILLRPGGKYALRRLSALVLGVLSAATGYTRAMFVSSQFTFRKARLTS